MASGVHRHTGADQDVSLTGGDGQDFRAALAVPAGHGEVGPAVIILHELLGLNDDMRRICARFGAEGYVALAPDFLHGLGPRPLCMARFMIGLSKGSAGRPFRRLETAHAWLAARSDVDGARIGVVGFCIGGGFALLYAPGADVAAVAPFYAAVPRDPETTLRGICPVVASYGGRDRVFGGGGAKLGSALDALGVEHDVKTYPEAGHSFMNEHEGPLDWIARRTPTRAGYHGPSADDAWARTLDFLGRHLAPTVGAGAHG